MPASLFAPKATLLVACMALLLVSCGNDSSGGSSNTQKVQCTLNSDCPTNQVCGTDGFCTTSFSGGDVAVTGDPDAVAGSDGAIGDIVATADAGSTPGKKGFCAECNTHADCGTAWRCEVLLNKGPGGSDHFCVPVCQADTECQDGVKCTLVDDGAKVKACIPPNYKCDGCSLAPCATGQSCAYLNDPPVCVKAAATCGSCDKNEDCAAKDICLDTDGNGKVCVPRCDGGQDCGPAAVCQPFAGGIEACAWQAETCCFGAGCKATAACATCPDKCIAGQCVECTKDDHCTDGKCNLTAKPPTCVKSACPDGKQQDASGACVDCLNATHCQPNEICVSGKCEAQSQDNVCKLCQDPYPACAKVNDQPVCVECAKDEDCKKKDAGTCDPKTYTCSKTTQGGAPDSGDCKTDADCVKKAGPTTKFDIACDANSGLCYDKNGYCDNITAFCNGKAGSKCKEQDLLGGGGGGSIPGLPAPPGGAQPGSGVCSCGAAASSKNPSSCDILPTCDCAKDPSSKQCDPLGIISCCALGCLEGLGGTSKPDPACFGGNSCLDMFCLINAMSGGTGGGGGGGYCSGSNATP